MDESQSKKSKHNEDIDRISNLPDVILCKILSYLPTKNAIATIVLSTKWKNVSPLLALPITLDLDDSLLLNPTKTKSYKPSITFKRFVDNLMYRYRTSADEPEIDVMILKCHKYYDVYSINSWIDEIYIRKLVLRVHLNASSDLLLLTVSGYTELTHFELGKGISIRVPDKFTLPNLKVLVLYKMIFGVHGREDMLSDLIAGCPVLEELCLSNCNLQHWGRAVIESSVIKKLSLKDCWLNECPCELQLDVPNLEVLVYDDYVAAKYYLSGFKSLFFAHIDVGWSEEEIHDHEAAGCDTMEDGLWFANGVGMVVTACSGTKRLFLATQSISVLQRSHEQLPTFQNLTFLELGCVLRSKGWALLSRLLCNAPNLEKLTLREGFDTHEGGFPSFLSALPKPPSCLEVHVREIEFCVFDEEEDETKLIEYFLMHGKVIQKVLQRSHEQLPTLQNLTFLELGCVWRSEGWALLSRLLCNAPNLEKLTLREGFGTHEGGFPSFLSALPKPPLCLEVHFREIEFCVFDEEEDETKLIEYFLMHGKVIQKVTLPCLPFKKSSSCSRLNMIQNYSKIEFKPR